MVSCLELPGIGLLVWLAFHMCTGDNINSILPCRRRSNSDNNPLNICVWNPSLKFVFPVSNWDLREMGPGEVFSSTKNRSYPPRKKLGPSTRQVKIADDVALQLVLLSKLFYLSTSHRLLLNRWWLNGWPAADTQTSSYIYCQFKKKGKSFCC